MMSATHDSGVSRILLVEDDVVDVKTVERAFRQREIGLDLEVRRSAHDALDALRSGEIEPHGLLILLDLNMPRMSGHEFLQELRTDPRLRRIPVVVLTTSRHEHDRQAAYDRGVAGYLVKPVTAETFGSVLERVTSYWSIMELA